MRQQELIYNAEFQIQQMERKVARGLGERSDEEKNKLNAEIAHHEAELEGARDKKKMLVAQVCASLRRLSRPDPHMCAHLPVLPWNAVP